MAEGHAKSVLRSEEELPQSGQDGQNGRCSHPPNPGAPRRAVPRARPQPMATPQAYPLGYVEDGCEPRTTLRAFFSILLVF